MFDHCVDDCSRATFMLHRLMLTVALREERMLVVTRSFEMRILQYASLPTTIHRYGTNVRGGMVGITNGFRWYLGRRMAGSAAVGLVLTGLGRNG